MSIEGFPIKKEIKKPDADGGKKKHLQPCETGGSLYGHARDAAKKASLEEGCSGEEDLRRAYNKLYKRQISALNKIIRHEK